jgi:hypothetical protein
MLAQSFKTAVELYLTDEQRTALIEVLALLETEKLPHIPNLFLGPWSSRYVRGQYFNMGKWLENYNCGTVSCIAGTACLISGNGALFNSVRRPSGLVGMLFSRKHRTLRRLFFPNVRSFDDITTEQAATALRSFLTTGDFDWHEITGQTRRGFGPPVN